eukprot:scaffold12181_cov213-Isochrysis_galbana.AAC.5
MGAGAGQGGGAGREKWQINRLRRPCRAPRVGGAASPCRIRTVAGWLRLIESRGRAGRSVLHRLLELVR